MSSCDFCKERVRAGRYLTRYSLKLKTTFVVCDEVCAHGLNLKHLEPEAQWRKRAA